MVMSKSVVDAQVSVNSVVVDITQKSDRWHLKSGKWNAPGIRIRKAIMDYLDAQTYHVAYSDIKNYLIQTIPDDCCDSNGSGFDKVVVINSIYGLGENIVQGRSTPDEFVLFKQ